MDFINDLIAKNGLTMVGGKVALRPITQQSFTAFPIKPEDNILHISMNEYIGLRLKMYQFSEDLKGIEPFAQEYSGVSQVPSQIAYSDETIRAAIGELTKMLEARNV